MRARRIILHNYTQLKFAYTQSSVKFKLSRVHFEVVFHLTPVTSRTGMMSFTSQRVGDCGFHLSSFSLYCGVFLCRQLTHLYVLPSSYSSSYLCKSRVALTSSTSRFLFSYTNFYFYVNETIGGGGIDTAVKEP